MIEKTKIMGIVNVTPDSFSDGGNYFNSNDAINHAFELINEGVDILDIGGQSTRPGYNEVSAEEEIRRIDPVIRGIRAKYDIPISIDTYFPEVADHALSIGANIINDVRGLDLPGMMEVAINYSDSDLIIMHSRPRKTELTVEEDIQAFYEEKYQACQKAGIDSKRIYFDPGIGFGKTPEENIDILKFPAKYRYKDFPLLYGVSRKRTIAHLVDENKPLERDYASITATLFSAIQGVEIVRVHEVKGMKDALTVWQKLSK